jgi:hypothetical protein
VPVDVLNRAEKCGLTAVTRRKIEKFLNLEDTQAPTDEVDEDGYSVGSATTPIATPVVTGEETAPIEAATETE